MEIKLLACVLALWLYFGLPQLDKDYFISSTIVKQRTANGIMLHSEVDPINQSGMGVTKAPFANFSVTGNFDLAKV